MKSSGIAYLLALAGLMTPFAGLHRLYLGRPLSGLLYLCTWGFLGIGTIVDLFQLPRMVDDENRRLLFPGSPIRQVYLQAGLLGSQGMPSPHASVSPNAPGLGGPTSAAGFLSPPSAGGSLRGAASLEQAILKVAREHQGVVSVSMVSLHTGMTLRKAKKELERLRKEGFCSVDVSMEGVKLYVFDGLLENKRLEFDD